MSADTLVHVVETYRYWILIPLSVVEGPIVALVAGMLAHFGYFYMYGLMLLFFVRDMIMDAVYYLLGCYGGDTDFAKRLLKRLGIIKGDFDEMRTLWSKHAGTTMFVGKLSYGIAPAFIVAAGAIRMPLLKFFGWGAVVAVAQYGTLLAIGYFFGASLGNNLGEVAQNTQYAVGGATLLISGYYIFTWYMRRKI